PWVLGIGDIEVLRAVAVAVRPEDETVRRLKPAGAAGDELVDESSGSPSGGSLKAQHCTGAIASERRTGDVQAAVRPECQAGRFVHPTACRGHECSKKLARCSVVAQYAVGMPAADVEVQPAASSARTEHHGSWAGEAAARARDEVAQEGARRPVIAGDPTP